MNFICRDCEKITVTQDRKIIPKYCCMCGSPNIGDEKEVIVHTKMHMEKVKRMEEVSSELNKMYKQIKPLNDEYRKLCGYFRGLKAKKIIETAEFVRLTLKVKCKQFRAELDYDKEDR